MVELLDPGTRKAFETLQGSYGGTGLRAFQIKAWCDELAKHTPTVVTQIVEKFLNDPNVKYFPTIAEFRAKLPKSRGQAWTSPNGTPMIGSYVDMAKCWSPAPGFVTMRDVPPELGHPDNLTPDKRTQIAREVANFRAGHFTEYETEALRRLGHEELIP